MDGALVVMEEIEKAFPGVQALRGCYFDLYPGEVHGLVGENGAGKSTLMKVLAGIYSKDAGRITYRGEPVEIPNPRAAQQMGISMIHQELKLMPHLTVRENIYLGREPLRWGFILNDNALDEETRKLFERMQLKLEPQTRVADLSVAMQQMVEIAKALSFESRILIMDEPTSALTEGETQALFRLIRQLREQRVAVVFITHRLEELWEITDRLTVMRDGEYIRTLTTQDATRDQVIQMMIGRTIYETAPTVPEDADDHEVLLEVRGLTREGVFRDVSFEARSGEILGFAGLMGAGRTDVARAIFGAEPVDAGEIYVKGQKVNIDSPHRAVKHSIGYLSEDRKRYGLALDLDVETNIVLATLERFASFLGWVQTRETADTAARYVEMLNVRTPSLAQRAEHLSGGNQQKVVISKWLAADTDILIFDEPTRGIDVGAKSEVYRLLNELAERGKAIIMISSELPELIRMSHRVVVMCEGRITGELAGDAITQEAIMNLATLREKVVAGANSDAEEDPR
ncbi:MAG: sugar ABC transporter ATP-binding protein [Anaerolineae bacterium]